MTTLLHITVSPRGALSHSRRAGQAAVQKLRAQYPALRVVERDLGRNPVMHPDAYFIEASLMPQEQRCHAQHAALAFSDALIDELDSADFILLSTPMHNCMVPSVLKAWLDQIVRPRRTFRITPAGGKLGLLRNRPVRVLLACGAALGDASVGQTDFATPYLRYMFEMIGVTDFQVLPLDSLNRGPAAQAAARRRLDVWLETLSLESIRL